MKSSSSPAAAWCARQVRRAAAGLDETATSKTYSRAQDPREACDGHRGSWNVCLADSGMQDSSAIESVLFRSTTCSQIAVWPGLCARHGIFLENRNGSITTGRGSTRPGSRCGWCSSGPSVSRRCWHPRELASITYRWAWDKARASPLTPVEYASPLACRVYDQRHACGSTWLNGGIARSCRRARRRGRPSRRLPPDIRPRGPRGHSH